MPASTSFISDAGSLFNPAVVSAIAAQKVTTPIRMTGDAALSTRDIQAICRYMKFPTPTPDVDFDELLCTNNHTRESLYVSLSRAIDLDVMIATAALRQGVTRVPDDKRLKPEPHAKAAKREAGAERAPRSATPRDLDDLQADAVIEAVAECPSKPGSERALRFALYKVGATLGDVIAAGVRPKDIRRHIADGSITVRQP